MKTIIIIPSVVVVMAFMFFTGGCVFEDASSESVKNVFLPLAVGNTWNYKVITEDYTGYDTFTITTSRVINGKTYFYFNKYPLFLPTIDSSKSYNTSLPVAINSDGCLVVWAKGGETVVYSIGPKTNGDFSVFKASGDTVLAGVGIITDCIRYRAFNKDVKDTEMEVWFSEKYGLVKIQYMATNCVILLESAKIK